MGIIVTGSRHSIRPSLNLDFANSKALDPRITFTRASNATYYDGYTSVKAEENLVSYSQEFNSWGKARTTVIANDTTAPDGTTTADAVYDNTENLPHYVYIDSTSFFTTYIYNVSCYVKNNGSDTVVIQLGVSGLNACTFNVSTGVVTATGGNCSQATITDVGNSWYRCSFQVDTVTANGNRYFVFLKNSAPYVGTGTDGLYLWGFQVEQRDSLTAYTPTTTAPITKYQPALQTAGNNVARFDHNPTTGESLGLLIEEQRTNLLTYSEQFDNASWGKGNLSVEANAIVAPNGTLTADKIIATTTSAEHRVLKNTTTTSGVSYTFSVYAKAGGYNFINFTGVNSTGWIGNPGPVFNLSTGTATGIGKIENAGNGWYRCSVSGVAPSSGADHVQIWISSSGGGNQFFAGNNFDGIYIWGAQYEAGAFPTSYIPTVASQVTRSADKASMTGTNFSDWYRQDEGSIYVEDKMINPSGDFTSAVGIMGGNTNDRRILLFRNYTGATDQFEMYNYGQQTAFNINRSVGVYHKVAVAFKTNDVAVSLDGQAALTDSVATIPLVDRLEFGSNVGTSFTVSYVGHIRKLAYYPLRLTNNELVDLSEE